MSVVDSLYLHFSEWATVSYLRCGQDFVHQAATLLLAVTQPTDTSDDTPHLGSD